MIDFCQSFLEVAVALLLFFLGGLLYDRTGFSGPERGSNNGLPLVFFAPLVLLVFLKSLAGFGPYLSWKSLDHNIFAMLLTAMLPAMVILKGKKQPLGHVLILLASAISPFFYTIVPSTSFLGISLLLYATFLLFHLLARHNSYSQNNTLYLVWLTIILLLITGLEQINFPLSQRNWIVLRFLGEGTSLLLICIGLILVSSNLSSQARKYLFASVLLFLALSIAFLMAFLHALAQKETDYFSKTVKDIETFWGRADTFECRCFKELKLVSGHPHVKTILSTRSDPNNYLSLFEVQLGASAIYIMDKKGYVMASSSGYFLGKNYGFRPYFKRAIRGTANCFFARGVNSHTLGAYFARPLVGEDGVIQAVITMKIPLEEVFSGLRDKNALLINQDDLVLMGPLDMENGILFSDSKIKKNSKQLSELLGGNTLHMLKFQRLGPKYVVSPGGKKYIYASVPIRPQGWEIAKLIPTTAVFSKNGFYYLASYLSIAIFSILSALRSIHIHEIANRLETERLKRVKAEGSRYLLSSIIEQGKEAIFLTDEKGIIEYVNGAASDLTGFTRDELLGQHPKILNGEGLDTQKFSKIFRQIRRGLDWNGRLTCKRKDGKTYEAECTIFSILDEEEKIKYVLIQKDVTREMLLEQQLIQAQKMEALGTLVGGVAHDFNNLLMALQGYAEVGLMKLKEGHPVRNFLNQILSVTQKASGIVRQLLVFGRQHIGEKTLINLNETIQDINKTLLRLIGENIQIVLDLEEGVPPVNADPINMEQVLINLVLNAKDAIRDRGEITIQTRTVKYGSDDVPGIPGARPGTYVRLSAKDTGSGIPKEIINRIFDPFFTTKGPAKGTGLGLSVVYSIVRQHEGWVTVCSEVNQGTTFHVYMPVATLAGNMEGGKSDEAHCQIDGNGHKILYIEDEEDILNIVSRYLEEYNFKVFGAGNLKLARKIYEEKQGSIDLILSDLVLPDGNSFEFIQGLSPNIPVIFCTGYINKLDIKDKILKMGFQFLNKPFAKSELIRTIGAVLNLRISP